MDDGGACPHCGDTRLVFDEAYQPRCWTCGGSRVRTLGAQPPQPQPGALLPSSASWYERWRAGDVVASRRSPEVQRRILLVIVVAALCMAGFVLLVVLTTNFDADPVP